MKNYFFALLASLIWVSCYQEPTEETVQVTGQRPIYLDAALIGSASSEAPKEFDNLGKIVSNGSLIYINEVTEGIHVVDNTDPTNPVRKHFWSIPGNIDFTIRGNFLYADSGFDLLTIDITDPAEIEILSTREGIYKGNPEDNFPINYFGPFECVDPSKGVVIGWEGATLINPKCRR